MSLFAEKNVHDLAGVDNYNACYGGTAAVLNSIDWLRAQFAVGAETKYAVVVAVDIADLFAEQAK